MVRTCLANTQHYTHQKVVIMYVLQHVRVAAPRPQLLLLLIFLDVIFFFALEIGNLTDCIVDNCFSIVVYGVMLEIG